MDQLQFPLDECFLRCDACGFETPPFCHGDNTQVFYCRTCSDIVDPEVVPFLFVPPKCVKCGIQLHRDDHIYTARLHGTDRIECPKCHKLSLALQSLFCEVSSYDEGQVPDIGQTVHGYVRHLTDRKLPVFFMSPCLPPRLSVKVKLTNATLIDLDDGYYEFTVEQVCEDQLLLHYNGQLPKSVWGGYFRPASEPEPKWKEEVPTQAVSCPHCGQALRTPRAQQCFECGADWHGTPANTA
jgi:hypothetical protein